MRLSLIIVLAVVPAFGQGYEVHGGDSTMMQAAGAEAKMTFANGSETGIGGGVIAGHFYGGLTESISYRGLNVHAGDLQIPFGLLTGQFQSGFPAIGVSASKGDKDSQDIWTAFAGETVEFRSIHRTFLAGERVQANGGILLDTETHSELDVSIVRSSRRETDGD